MGGIVSKREAGLLDAGDDQSQFSSPSPLAVVPSHFLPRDLDPRSPSAGIDRTPIPVLTPQETVSDPRSPSVGIVRTPITCLPAESASECLDSKPSDPSPIPQFRHCDLDSSEVCEDTNVCVPVSTDSAEMKAASRPATADVKLLSNSRVSYAVSPASNKLFGSNSASQRSPLAPRNFIAPQDSSTPRNIIHRKQSAQVDKLRGLDAPTSESLMTKRQQQPLQSSWDKENM